MTNSDISLGLRFYLSASPANCKVSDNTDYVGGGYLDTEVSGLLNLKTAAGVFYTNAGYATDDFSAPDITGGVMYKAGIALPLDAFGEVLQGDYTAEYKVQIKTDASTISITAFPLDTIIVGGDVVTKALAADLVRLTGTNLNDGDYTVVTATYNGSLDRTTIRVAESLSAETIVATCSMIKSLEASDVQAFCFIEPEVSMSATSNCFTSQLTSSDDSTYTAFCGTTAISPSSTTRTHTINYPQGSDPSSSTVVGSTATLTTVENIWTGEFYNTVSTALTYILTSGIIVDMTATGDYRYTVECNSCICNASVCIEALYDRFVAAIGTNPRQATDILNKLVKANTLLALYKNYVMCGEYEEADAMCTALAALLRGEGNCCSSSTHTTVEVIPEYTGSTGTGSVVVTTSGNGIIVNVSVIGSTTTNQLSLDQTIIEGIVNDIIAALSLGDSDSIDMDNITVGNCFSIADGDTLTEAINKIISVLCPLISGDGGPDRGSEYPDKYDFTPDGEMYRQDNPYIASELTYNDVSGGGDAKIEIVANDYYTYAHNTSKITETVYLDNNSDNYIFLDYADDFAWAVSAVSIGAGKPATDGECVLMVTTGSGSIVSVSILIGYYPITNDEVGMTGNFEIIASGNTLKGQAGNFRFINTAPNVWEAQGATALNTWITLDTYNI